MMGLGRERRLNCRLYVDRQSDAKVVEKLDRLLVEKHFLNQTELIKHGIELVYREVYEGECEGDKSGVLNVDLQKMAEVIAEELKSDLGLFFEGAEARIIEKIAGAKESFKLATTGNGDVVSVVNEGGVVVTDAATQSDKRTEEDADVPAEKVLSGSAISFLKGLNDD